MKRKKQRRVPYDKKQTVCVTMLERNLHALALLVPCPVKPTCGAGVLGNCVSTTPHVRRIQLAIDWACSARVIAESGPRLPHGQDGQPRGHE